MEDERLSYGSGSGCGEFSGKGYGDDLDNSVNGMGSERGSGGGMGSGPGADFGNGYGYGDNYCYSSDYESESVIIDCLIEEERW